jgi:hypothetical protein
LTGSHVVPPVQVFEQSSWPPHPLATKPHWFAAQAPVTLQHVLLLAQTEPVAQGPHATVPPHPSGKVPHWGTEPPFIAMIAWDEQSFGVHGGPHTPFWLQTSPLFVHVPQLTC